MDMKVNDTSYEWFESLSDPDKSSVDEVMFDLSYFEYVLGDK